MSVRTGGLELKPGSRCRDEHSLITAAAAVATAAAVFRRTPSAALERVGCDRLPQLESAIVVDREVDP